MADASPDSAPASTKQAALLEALERRITGHEARVAAKKERTEALSAALTSSDLSAEEREAMMREHAEMEKVFSRRYRRRFSRADFESLAIVGKGHFGEVHVVRARPSAGEDVAGMIYALKVMRKDHVKSTHKLSTAKAERDVLAEAYDRWVLGLHFAFQDAENLYLVMDYMAGGDLMGLLIAKDTFPEAATRIFAAEMVMAVGSVHAMGYIHRDVKPDNILIDEHGHLKLADLGLATKIDDGDALVAAADAEAKGGSDLGHAEPAAATKAGHRSRRMAFTVCGTCDYMAPEVLLRRGYDKTADWWAVGAIIFECVFGYAPFWAENAEGTARKIVHWRHYLRLPAPSAHLSAECLDFMARLLNKADRRLGRMGTDEVKAHPWFAGIDWKTLGHGDGPYVSAPVAAAASAMQALKTMPATDPGFTDAVKSLTVSFEEARVVPGDAAAAPAKPAAKPAEARSAASSGVTEKVVGYTFSRQGEEMKPPRKRETKASAMLAKSRAAASAKSGSGST